MGQGQVREPCTVMTVGDLDISTTFLLDTIARFERSDDVWSKRYLKTLVVQSDSFETSLQPDAKELLEQYGNQQINYIHVSNKSTKYPEGPYFLEQGNLHASYRLYPDTSGAFVVATVPSSDPFQSLDAAAYGETYPSTLTIAVPSRLSFTKTETQPFAGYRIGIKDIIDLKGLRTGASSRAYTQLYGPRIENAAVVHKLLELGFVIVGKLKTTQFADTEWATSDWVDYHAPFNPRADGYQDPSASSAGSAAAIATYKWLDFTIGTDTLGSIRDPATVQGIFGMRPSLGAASCDGIIPYSGEFDTVGGFARNAEDFAKLSRALYHSATDSECKKEPVKILYPTDYWPVEHEESQAVFEAFVVKLELHLGIQRTRISLEETWQKTKVVETDLALAEYFEHVFEWAANRDQWSSFMEKFFEDYQSKFGRAAVVNPQLQFKRDYSPTITKEEQEKGFEQLEIFRSWWEKSIMPPSKDGCTDTIFVVPWSTGKPDYRDKYPGSAPGFTGIGFFIYSLSPYAGAPEIIVPVGQTSFISKITMHKEWLPAAIGIIGTKGSDVKLAELVRDVLGTEASVETGPTAFKVAMEKATHEPILEQQVMRD
ncbi:MAG: hypothetical protein Q9226_006377 [Calogaya cf. arnoldii]